MQSVLSVYSFRQQLKIFLFHQSFPDSIVYISVLRSRILCNSLGCSSHANNCWFTLTMNVKLCCCWVFGPVETKPHSSVNESFYALCICSRAYTLGDNILNLFFYFVELGRWRTVRRLWWWWEEFIGCPLSISTSSLTRYTGLLQAPVTLSSFRATSGLEPSYTVTAYCSVMTLQLYSVCPGEVFTTAESQSHSPSLSSPSTLSTFYSRLKTHLFHKSFPP